MKNFYTTGLILILNLFIEVSGGDDNTTNTVSSVPSNTTDIRNEPHKAEGIPANSFRSYPSKSCNFSHEAIFLGSTLNKILSNFGQCCSCQLLVNVAVVQFWSMLSDVDKCCPILVIFVQFWSILDLSDGPASPVTSES